MCTPQCVALSNIARLCDSLARLHNTSDGFSETELKLLAATPASRPSSARVVTTVTPVAYVLIALRRSAGVAGGLWKRAVVGATLSDRHARQAARQS